MARDEIVAGAGSQFDPQVVDAMLRIFDEFVDRVPGMMLATDERAVAPYPAS